MSSRQIKLFARQPQLRTTPINRCYHVKTAILDFQDLGVDLRARNARAIPASRVPISPSLKTTGAQVSLGPETHSVCFQSALLGLWAGRFLGKRDYGMLDLFCLWTDGLVATMHVEFIMHFSRALCIFPLPISTIP